MPDFQPDGHTTVAPWLVTDDTGALLDFISTVLGGEELDRVEVEDGSIGHAEIRVGDTVLLAFDRKPDWPALPSLLRVWVPDADVAVALASEAGATIVTPLGNNAFGQRGARIRDPFGNIWWIETQIENLSEDEMWNRLQQPEYAEDMRTAQETLDVELSGRSTGSSSAPVRSKAGDRD